MAVTITIGEKFWNEQYEPPAWDVRRVSLPDAPVFPGDATLEPAANWRYVNYPDWLAMAEEVGLVDWLTHPEKGILRTSGVIFPITEEHYRMVSEAYLLRSVFAEGTPGWEAEIESDDEVIGDLPESVIPYDPFFARLIWLRFWIRWALDNCDEPSVVVSW